MNKRIKRTVVAWRRIRKTVW